MDITNTQLEWLMNNKWDDDVRQDVIIKILEHGGPVENFEAWTTTVYNNTLNSARTLDARRRELLVERQEELVGLHGHDDVQDPLELLEAEDMLTKMNWLSPLLYGTLREYTLGKTPEEIAEEQGVDANVIYQRIWQAKKEITNGR